MRYEYSIKDHLGNTRLNFTDKNGDGKVAVTTTTNEILSESHYYPFGMAMSGPWMDDASARDNQYKYNGKELNEDFGLGWYDYGARWYDASLGRWNVVDPMSDGAFAVNPYNYVLNNPVKLIDPLGLYAVNHDTEATKLMRDEEQRASEARSTYNHVAAVAEAYANGGSEGNAPGGKLRGVEIVVTNQKVGKAKVSGYTHANHRTDDEFEVPTYKMTVTGKDKNGKKQSRDFEVIRYGVQQSKTGGAASVVGLSEAKTYILRSWNPDYLAGNRFATPGAWRIDGLHLLHDGADDPTQDAWGAIGCIEVCGGTGPNNDNFSRMNWLIREWTGASAQTNDVGKQY